jgi:hypothetical protein
MKRFAINFTDPIHVSGVASFYRRLRRATDEVSPMTVPTKPSPHRRQPCASTSVRLYFCFLTLLLLIGAAVGLACGHATSTREVGSGFEPIVPPWVYQVEGGVVGVANGGTGVTAGGGLTTGNGLYASGSSALTYSALNLAGGSGWVTGTLPALNLPSLTFTGDTTGNGAIGSIATTTGKLNGGNGGQFAAANTDFLSLGASPAATGLIRVPSNAGVNIISMRNSANTGDLGLISASTGTTVSSTLLGGNYASLGASAPASAGAAYIMTTPLEGTNVVGGLPLVVTRQGYSSVNPPAATAFNGIWGVVGGNTSDNGTGNVWYGNNLTSFTSQATPLASTSAASGAAGYTVTYGGQAGQPATGASHNGGNGGNVAIGGGAGGTSGSATAGVGGFVSVTSGELVQQVTVTTTYTVDTNTTTSDLMVFCNGASAFTITMPTPTAGRHVEFEDISGAASSHNITLSHHSSENINGASTLVISTNYGGYNCTSNGTNWFCK